MQIERITNLVIMNQVILSIDCDDLPDCSDALGPFPSTSSESQYETVNEINAEARALIASWERNFGLIDYDPCHSPDQLRAMSAVTVHSATSMPPPMRYRRVPKNASIG